MAQSGVCRDVGNEARPPVAHRNCSGNALQFVGGEVVRFTCDCACHRLQLMKVMLPIVDAAEPLEVLCSQCKALLEDGPADTDLELDFEEVFALDRRFSRTIDGQTLCPNCQWSRYGGLGAVTA